MADSFKDILFAQLRADYVPLLSVENAILHGDCEYYAYLRTTQDLGVPPPEPTELLAEEVTRVYTNTVRGYFEDTFGDEFIPGFDFIYKDHFIIQHLGELRGQPVCFVLVPESKYSTNVPNRTSVLAACVRAWLVDSSVVILVTMNRNKQEWSFWEISGDVQGRAQSVLRSLDYAALLHQGKGYPLGSSPAVCALCTLKEYCPQKGQGSAGMPYGIQGLTIKRVPRIAPMLDQQRVRRNLREQEDEAPAHSGTIRTSTLSITKCNRRLCYMLMGTEGFSQFRAPLLRIFDFGHAAHDVVQTHIGRALEEDLEMELPLADPQLRLTGHQDLYQKSRRRLGEIKTIALASFRKLTAPQPAHITQNHIYAGLLEADQRPVDDIEFLYIAKETFEVQNFVVPFTRARWYKVAKKVTSLVKMASIGELAPQIDSPWECKECQFVTHCKPNKLHTKRERF